MSPQVEAAVIAASVGVLTLIATVVTQYLGRRATSRDTEKTLDRTLAEQREQLDRTLAEQRTRTLNERFATAAEQLGSDKPSAVRLAGVYAMAGLADDWEENRQTCVDVLCAYLRMPYERDPGGKAPAPDRLIFQADREVRHTVIRVITAHLKAGAAVSWRGLDFDFTGVVFDGGDFRFADFSGGTVNFLAAQFPGGRVDFGQSRFSGGTVEFGQAQSPRGTVNFSGAQFSSGTVNFGTLGSSGAQFSDGTVNFSGAQFSGATVNFIDARFYFKSALFSDGRVSFLAAQFSSGTVSFSGAQFSGGKVSFGGGSLILTDAESTRDDLVIGVPAFSGGTVDFSNPRDWSVPPAFPWTGTPPPGVKLPKKEDQSQA